MTKTADYSNDVIERFTRLDPDRLRYEEDENELSRCDDLRLGVDT